MDYRRYCAHAPMKQSIRAIASLRTVDENALMGLENKKPINMTEADERLRQWRRKHDTPAKVAAAHRAVLLQRVSESMAFEGQSARTERLKILFGRKDASDKDRDGRSEYDESIHRRLSSG